MEYKVYLHILLQLGSIGGNQAWKITENYPQAVL